LPFFGTVHIGYIPNGTIVGLSKLARTVEYYSKRLNTQEYLTNNIAEFLNTKLKPRGIGVIITGRHLCQEMRGIKKRGEMITSALKGIFLEEPKVKQEFFNLTKGE
jgi:GTP cyclohydrolase I